VDSAEPIFGLAVTGLAVIENLKRNDTAQEGDILFLTKPLGTGILSTAQKRNAITQDHLRVLVNNMTLLNNAGEELGRIPGVHAMTDVTGFGLAGHLIEMMEGCGLSAVMNYSAVPLLEGAREYLAARIIPDATYRNWNSYGKKAGFEKGVNVMEAFSVLPDPQTNGGLLLAVDPSAQQAVSALLKQRGLHSEPIGRVVERAEKIIRVEP
jgi:selenide,water dikinase